MTVTLSSKNQITIPKKIAHTATTIRLNDSSRKISVILQILVFLATRLVEHHLDFDKAVHHQLQ